MAAEKNNKTLNVPNLRFPEFSGEWETSILLDVCEINPKTPSLDEEFVYIDLESVEKGTILHENVISRDDAPSRAQRVLKFNDILFQCVRPYQKNNLLFAGDTHTLQYVASTGYAQIRTDKQNPAFLYQLLNTQKFVDQVILRCTGTSYPAINANDLSKIPICYPLQIEEQNKIAKLLSLLDNRIETQKKIIEDLKKLKDAISCKNLFDQSWKEYKISEISILGRGRVISTTEISRQEKPQYPVYSSQTSNNGIMGYLDDYDFDGEYITWTTDGANAGTVFYRNGRFNCTNVCGTIKVNKNIDAYFLSVVLQSATARYVSINLANPKLMNSTMASIKVKLPDIDTQKYWSRILQHIDKKIDTEFKYENLLIQQKIYLLLYLFI